MTDTTQIQIRCTFEEKAAIQARAKKNGKGVSEFLRDLALQGVTLREPTPPEEITRPTPKPEEVEKLAVKIHNTEGLPMPRSRTIALLRLSTEP